ncbi:hypothetical protein KEM52_000659 [Ascosphaera acerosa]|nr:hypothetical protein KEM52_000659 [Ascosphaera acerosa]
MVLVDKYNASQSRRPYVTQLVCTLVIYLLGDLCAQAVSLSGSEKGEDGEDGDETATDAADSGAKATASYDPARTVRHLMVGGMLAVPNFKWFDFLHHHFNYRSVPLSILTKVTVSQIFYTPIFNVYFFAAHSLLAGSNIADTVQRLATAVPASVVNSIMVWPLVTGLTFLYVQPQYRSLFSGVVAIGWQTYLSWLNSKAARQVKGERTADRRAAADARVAVRPVTTALAP